MFLLAVSFSGVANGAEGIRETGQSEKTVGIGWDLALGIPAELPPGHLSLDGPLLPETLRTLAGRVGWARLADRSQMAPVRVAVMPVEAPEGRIGHQVQLVFTLSASLSTFQEKTRGKRALGVQADAAGNTARVLTERELNQAGVGTSAAGTTLAFLSMTLLNRVDLQGVIQAERRDGADGTRLTWAFDHRFDDDSSLQAYFRRWDTNPLGERVQGDPQPYPGAAGMIVVRNVSEHVEATNRPLLLVESRMVFAEPKAWFGGGNLLRAKIPLLTQEGVRSLRRRLAEEGR